MLKRCKEPFCFSLEAPFQQNRMELRRANFYKNVTKLKLKLFIQVKLTGY